MDKTRTMEAPKAFLTPAEFVTKFPGYVYRSHKGQESVQWRAAALDMAEDRAQLLAALRALYERAESGMLVNHPQCCAEQREETAQACGVALALIDRLGK